MRASPPRTSRGLIHRDFKPDNVLVGKDGKAALRILVRHALGEPDALAGLDELLVRMPEQHGLTQRLEPLR